jgi:hypothetical protein
MWLWKVAVAMAMFQPQKKINHWEKKGFMVQHRHVFSSFAYHWQVCSRPVVVPIWLHRGIC